MNIGRKLDTDQRGRKYTYDVKRNAMKPSILFSSPSSKHSKLYLAA
jgi:hypothetical protein